MKATNIFLYLLLLLPLVAFGQSVDEGAVGDPDEELIVHAIAQVPPPVMAAARAAAPDVYFDSAQSYWLDDWRVYRVSGRLFREVWHVYVRSDGKLLRTESDTQDD